MSKFILSLSAIFLLSACGSEVVLEGSDREDPEPEARTMPTSSPTIGERPPEGSLPPDGTGGGPLLFCHPGEVFICTVEDGSIGIRVCLDGYQLTVCSDETPVPH